MASYTRVDLVDGVAVITIDNPPVNALGPGVLEAIEAAVARAAADPTVRAVVLAGAGATFVAGADINVFKAIRTREQALDECGMMHALLRRIEDAPKPVVAAIHGHALGGGLELAMACHYRVAALDAKMGQPEVLLGLIPGAGGTQRLPRLCGAPMALDMCACGQPISAPEALAAGLIDRIADEDRQHLIDAAVRFSRGLAASQRRQTREVLDKLADVDAALRACEQQRGALDPIAGGPAPYAAVNAIEAACMLPFDAGSALERELFADCVLSDASRALLHLFFAEREASKVPDVPAGTPTHEIRRAAILGAGTMGTGIAIAYADAGISVVLKDIDQAALARSLAAIRRHYQSLVLRGVMSPEMLESTMTRISTTTTFDGFETADLVTEAVFEDRDLKKAIFAELGHATRPDCLLASTTSTLDIDEIAQASRRPAQVIGHHFFQPVRTKLLEIIRGRETSREAIATSLKLAKRLGKVAVVVGNCGGSVALRLKTAYIREAVQLQQEGAAAPQIKRALTRFGMPAGPFEASDITRILPARAERDASAQAGDTQELLTDGSILRRLTAAIASEGTRVLEEGCVSRPGDLDIISCYAFSFPRVRGGPMFYASSTRS